MTETELKSLLKKANQYAFSILKDQDHAEDIAQDVVLKALEKPDRKHWVKHRVIDAIRSRFGRKGMPNGEKKMSRFAMETSLSAPVYDDGVETHQDRLVDQEKDALETLCDVPEPSPEIHFKNWRQKIMWEARQSGIQLQSIARAFGVSNSLVSLELRPFLLQEKLDRKKRYAEKAVKCAGTIEVDWWVL